MAVYQVGSETSGPSRYRFWTQRRVRASLYQALPLIAIGIILFFFARNATLNLASRGLTAGFGFLGKEAGFGIGFSIIPYSETSSYGRAFLVGLTNTILVAATAIVCSTILGFILGVP